MTIGNWILSAAKREGQLAVQFKKDREWHSLSWAEYLDRISAAYAFLKKSGLKNKTHVGLISNTRWEWSALDLAVLGGGGIFIPLYPNLSDDDFLFTINHSEIEILIVESIPNPRHIQIEDLESKQEEIFRSTSEVSEDQLDQKNGKH